MLRNGGKFKVKIQAFCQLLSNLKIISFRTFPKHRLEHDENIIHLSISHYLKYIFFFSFMKETIIYKAILKLIKETTVLFLFFFSLLLILPLVLLLLLLLLSVPPLVVSSASIFQALKDAQKSKLLE